MTNTHVGEATLTLDGKEYILVYDWDAIARLQSSLGKDFDQKIAQASIDVNLEVIAQTLSIALIKRNPLTVEEIKALSPPILEVTSALGRALNLAFYGKETLEQEVAAQQPENPPLETSLKTDDEQPSEPDSNQGSSGA